MQNGPLTDSLFSVYALLCTLLLHCFRNITPSLFFVHVVLFLCYTIFTFSVLHSVHVLLFPYYTFLALHSFHVTHFPCCIFSVLQFFVLHLHVALILCCIFSVLHYFQVCRSFQVMGIFSSNNLFYL